MCKCKVYRLLPNCEMGRPYLVESIVLEIEEHNRKRGCNVMKRKPDQRRGSAN